MTPIVEATSTERFSDRVAYYAAYRPGYPDSMIHYLKREAGLLPDMVIADIGSGTGNSAEPFLRHGHAVYGVEPNSGMRRAGEDLLRHYPKFYSVTGAAENTALPDAGVDWIVAASAFHWFDGERARAEFQRILKPCGNLLVMSNHRRKTGDAFMAAYGGIFRKYAVRARAREGRDERVHKLFAPHACRTAKLDYRESLDFRQLSGRLMSYSTIPLFGRPGHDAMMNELREAFESASQDGRVQFEGEVTLDWGSLRRS
jgi:SAM-dependent methyltransferase